MLHWRPTLLLVLLALPGCTSNPGTGSDAPSAALADPDSTTSQRRGAVDALAEQARAATDPAVKSQLRESIKRMAWKRSETPQVRLAAIDALAADPAGDADTVAMLNLMLPTENSWPVIERASTLAREHGWKDMTSGLIRSWSRPVPDPTDDARPERAALIALRPGVEPPTIVFDFFATPATGQFAERARSDAWTLLCRIDPGGVYARRRLADGPLPSGADTDPFIADLRAAAELGAFPATTEQFDWLRDLRSPTHANWWSAARDAVASLTPAQREGLELRHAAVLLWARDRRPGLLGASREELASQARAALAGRKTHLRTADTPVASAAVKESLDAWQGRLVWADLLSIVCAVEAISDPAVTRALFEQADADMADSSTEHGGVLDAPKGSTAGFTALAYPPRPSQRVSDTRFVASSDLLTAGAASLFHYHFHAQKHDNDEYAGPGPGDLDYARIFGRACVVFTFASRNALGADYYQPNGARIDLGEIRRP